MAGAMLFLTGDRERDLGRCREAASTTDLGKGRSESELSLTEIGGFVREVELSDSRLQGSSM